MTVKLEHANLTVRDVDETVRFVTTAFPGWKLRGEGKKPGGGRWLHVGDDDFYLALSEAQHAPAEPWEPYCGKPGLNHLGFEVDAVEPIRQRMLAAGYTESTVSNAHPHRRRLYFYDAEGNDWEFVEYRSDDPELRNDYELPDF